MSRRIFERFYRPGDSIRVLYYHQHIEQRSHYITLSNIEQFIVYCSKVQPQISKEQLNYISAKQNLKKALQEVLVEGVANRKRIISFEQSLARVGKQRRQSIVFCFSYD